jgi:LysM repeat protein
MKSFKKFIIEENETDYVTPLYRALISAEHRGVVKDPTKFDEKIYIRTKYKPKDNISTAYGPGQITLGTIEDAVKRHPDLFDKSNSEYVGKFIEQGKKMKTAAPDDASYGYGCKGDLCAPEYHEPYEKMATSVVKSKLRDAGIDTTKPLEGDSLNTAIQRWRGKPEKEDAEYFKVARENYSTFLTPPKTPNIETEKIPKKNPTVATSTDGDYYTVQSGDTLWKLGGGTPEGVKKLQDLNPEINPDKIKPGQKIKKR